MAGQRICPVLGELFYQFEASRGGKTGGEKTDPAVDQLDFEFVLFASAVIDYDYIMKLITDFQAKGPIKSTMNREQLIGLIAADSKFLDVRETSAFAQVLVAGEPVEFLQPLYKNPLYPAADQVRQPRRIF